MIDYSKINAKYRGIPCWYNKFNEEIKGKNLFYDILIDIAIWIDINIIEVEEFPIWIEIDNFQK